MRISLKSIFLLCAFLYGLSFQCVLADEHTITQPERFDTKSNFILIGLKKGLSFELPRNWMVISNNQLVTLDAYVELLQSAQQKMDETPSDLSFAANLYDDLKRTIGILNVRFYPEMDISQADVRMFKNEDIETIDAQLHTELEYFLRSSGMKMVAWNGTTIKNINGISALISEYYRKSTKDNGNFRVQLVRVLAGDRSFTLTISYHERAEFFLKPITDHLINSIKVKSITEPKVKTFQDIRQLAQKGDVLAQFTLCITYWGGNSGSYYREAFKWCEMAAAQGYAPAQSFLGNMYLKGLGVPQDFKLAREWLEKAAHKNEGGGQFLLGLMYLEGLGAPKDYAQAYMWINLSAAKFFSPNIINKISNLRDNLRKKMLPEKIKAAQELSRKWELKQKDLWKNYPDHTARTISDKKGISLIPVEYDPFEHTARLVMTADIPYVIEAQPQLSYEKYIAPIVAVFLILTAVLLLFKYRGTVTTKVKITDVGNIKVPKRLELRIIIFLLLVFAVVTILLFIDRVVFLYYGLVDVPQNESKLSLIPVLLSALTIRYGLKVLVFQKPLVAFQQKMLIFLSVLFMIHTAALLFQAPKERKVSSDVSTYMLHSAAMSTPEILIASIPYAGIPLVVMINAQQKLDKKALREGGDPREFWSFTEFGKAMILPPW